jgi:hypothetical protein
MSLIKKPHELKPRESYIGCIYGEPGIGKTTLALSARNCIILDFEKGLVRVKAAHLKDYVDPDNLKQVTDVIYGNEIKSYDTIIVDSLGRMIECVINSLIADRTIKVSSGGNIPLQAWGSVKGKCREIVRQLRSLQKNIIFLAHVKEDRQGENTKKRIDADGTYVKDLMRDLDYLGYFYTVDEDRILDFKPNKDFFAKNPSGFDQPLVVPKPKDINTFFQDKILDVIIKNEEDSHQKKMDRVKQNDAVRLTIDEVKTHLESLTTREDKLEMLNVFYKSKYPSLKQIDNDLSAYLMQPIIKSIECTFDKTLQQFVLKS